jgi:hypothetical protein
MKLLKQENSDVTNLKQHQGLKPPDLLELKDA